MPGPVTWQSDERCVVGDTTFQILPPDALDRREPVSREGADFLLLKERPLVELYAEVLTEMRPRHIFELGILEGGGTAFLFELAQPRRLIAIDHKPPTRPALRDYIARRGLEEVISIRDDVDQADRGRLAEIAEGVLGDDPLDLVVDDCSHMYGATRASFNELFPRLRPGGLYVIEDWRWAHIRTYAEMWVDQVPLSRLILELVLASACVPGLISEITIDAGSVQHAGLAQVKRGDANVHPLGFDIISCLDRRARTLLAGDAAGVKQHHPGRS
jgi:hypothetical protein